MASTVRLFVEHPLGKEQSVALSRTQAHYLFGVMRLTVGQTLLLINGIDGEWQASVVEAGKKGGALLCHVQTRPLHIPPDLWLMFAPLRKERTAFVVEKAVELGVRRLIPVQTAYTNQADRLRIDKIEAQVIEASEQCGATYVPQVDPLAKLAHMLDTWDMDRQILFADEALVGQPATQLGAQGQGAPWAILIGPEGGFSPQERDMLQAMKPTHRISLGPRILRAETAAVAALTLWQSQLGDWQ
jgi:16S rRNA (uracil1498-N3)-methyltransferase